MRELQGRVGVVTGAARGIGRGLAQAMVAEGMRVVMSDLPSPQLEASAARLAESGGEVVAIGCDVSDPEAVAALAAATIDAFGDVNLLCNNAGVMAGGRTWELSLGDWHRVLDVNLWGAIHGIRSFVPLLLESAHGGHVVNVASMAAVMAVPGIAPYNVSKHGVLALSETLRADLVAAGADIGVTVVLPGRVATGLGQPPGTDPPSAARAGEEGVLSPETVGRQVMGAVKEDRLFLFTHPDRLGGVQARFAAILTDGSA